MLVYYLCCLFYSIAMSSLTWYKNARDGGQGITPALDSLAIVLLCWALAPVDLWIRLLKVVKKAEEHRIRQRQGMGPQN